MKLTRYRDSSGGIIPARLMDNGQAHDLRALVHDVTPDTLSPAMLDRIAGAGPDILPVLDTDALTLAPPVARPRTIWCVGLNYSDHAAETGKAVPEEPILFSKASSAYCGPNVDIPHGPGITKLDWEVELGVIIGRPAHNIPESTALDHVAGYTLVNDVSERAWQQERSGQWIKGKSGPNFCPTGPWLVTADALGDPQAVDLWLDVNGERRQTGSTATMVFGVAHLVAYISQFALLEPGDLICTGTPPGVGAGMTPPTFLRPGDVITLGGAGLGTQRQVIVDPT